MTWKMRIVTPTHNGCTLWARVLSLKRMLLTRTGTSQAVRAWLEDTMSVRHIFGRNSPLRAPWFALCLNNHPTCSFCVTCPKTRKTHLVAGCCLKGRNSAPCVLAEHNPLCSLPYTPFPRQPLPGYFLQLGM